MNKQHYHNKAWKEEINVKSNQLVDKVKAIIESGNVSRIIIRNKRGLVLIDFSLNAGIIVGGVVTCMLPLVVALTAIAAMVSEVKIEIIRIKPRRHKNDFWCDKKDVCCEEKTYWCEE